MNPKLLNLWIVTIALTIVLIGCGSQNEHLAKGKELIKSDKRRKEERAAQQFKLAIQQEPNNAEAHYLLGYHDSEEFWPEGSSDRKAASIEGRGKHMFLAYQDDKRKYLQILVFETLRTQFSDVPEVALAALKLVYKQGDRKKLLKHLKKALKSKDNRDRHDAQWVLAALGKEDPDTIVPILVNILKDKKRGTRLEANRYERLRTGRRINAVKALGEIGSEKAIPVLVQIINSGSAKRKKDRESPEVRRLAVEALGKIGAVEELVKLVKNKGTAMRVDAIEALEKLGDERAVNPLLNVLGEQGNREVVVQFR